jgi:hypothetical protein
MEHRKFSVADGMVFVAATAVGFSLARVNFKSIETALTSSRGLIVPGRTRVAAAAPLLACWTAALLAHWLLKPRPPLRRLLRLPGFSACAAASFGVALCVASTVLELGVPAVFIPSVPGPFTFFYSQRMVGYASLAVAWAWASLALSRSWRRDREGDWREGLGRLLGWAWLVLVVLVEVSWRVRVLSGR